jgi:subtilisin family serine protease
MKKVYATALAMAFVGLGYFGRSPVYSKPSKRTRPVYAAGEILVKLKKSVEGPSGAEAAGRALLPALAIHAQSLLKTNSGGIISVSIDPAASVEEAVALARSSPEVEYAEPDYLYFPADTLPNDPIYTQGKMWGVFYSGKDPYGGTTDAGIDAPRAWDITTGSDEVVAAVTDTGIDLSHPDLAPNAWVNPVDGSNGYNFFSGNTQVYDPSTDIGQQGSHGTHVTGTIGAVGNNDLDVTGVAWHVKLMALKFMGADSTGNFTGSTQAAIKAINYTINQKMAGVNVRVINASWDGPKFSQALHDAIVAAGEAGILFVCAAGNNDFGPGLDLDDPNNASYPGAWNDIPTLISVAAVDTSSNLASFSDFGHQTVTVAAPGVNIWSTWTGGLVNFISGTSMASPHVAGIAVLLAAHDPTLTPAQMKQLIINSCQPTITLASRVASSGRVNAYYALSGSAPPPDYPAVRFVSATKKILSVDGLGFLNGSAVIKVNGNQLGPVQYDPTYTIGNTGELSRVSVKLGKALMSTMVPLGTPVSITVFNPSTGQESTPFSYTRF